MVMSFSLFNGSHNLHVVHLPGPRVPAEANAELVVNADAVLALAVTSQRLQAVAQRRVQVVQRAGRVEVTQLSQRLPGNGVPAAVPPGAEQFLGVRVGKACDQVGSV
jgi:hypothetical protein